MIVLLPDAPIDDDIAHDLLEAKLHGAMVVDYSLQYGGDVGAAVSEMKAWVNVL